MHLRTDDFLDQLMREAAALLGLPRLIAYEDKSGWAFPLDAQTLLQAEHNRALDTVTLCVPIDSVPQTRRLEVYENLLAYNAEWRETGGTRMALPAQDSPVLLLLDVPAAQLHIGLLVDLLTNLFTICCAWRTILRDLEQPSDRDIASRHPVFADGLPARA